MRRSHRIALLPAIAVPITGAWWLRKEIAIDSCLDDGGAWHYITGKCATD
ncbi:MAG TPA: hypothetical protein PKE36_09660 [Chiayiivirga sp.]|jgi:hypothetical protein|nr:hypothetical protein [Chiayiivirga sp.]